MPLAAQESFAAPGRLAIPAAAGQNLYLVSLEAAPASVPSKASVWRPSSQPAGSARRLALALALCGLGLGACSATDARSADSHGELRVEAWQGVYQGPYHLHLAIQMHGADASGSWQAVGSRNGAFTGKVSGEQLTVSWEEHGADGGAWSGRGYFVYRAAHGALPPEIFGERGFGRSSSGSSWWAVKRPDTPLPSEVVDSTSHGDTGDDRECVGCDSGSDQDER